MSWFQTIKILEMVLSQSLTTEEDLVLFDVMYEECFIFIFISLDYDLMDNFSVNLIF